MNRELNLIGEVSHSMRAARDNFVIRCNNFSDAMRLCMELSPVHRTHQSWADLLGMRVNDFTQMLNSSYANRKRNFPPELIPDFELHAQNTALTQWLDAKRNQRLICQKPPEEQIDFAIEHFQRIS